MVEDKKTVVILDNGTETIKAGLSTSDKVDFTFPSIVG